MADLQIERMVGLVVHYLQLWHSKVSQVSQLQHFQSNLALFIELVPLKTFHHFKTFPFSYLQFMLVN